MLSAITVVWITLDLVGLFSLLILLTTFVLVKSLPQRKNPFLINLILTTFLATIPPCMLFITGNQDSGAPTHWICMTQAVLMDSIAPMFGTALVVLVFHTWSELRSILGGKIPFTMQNLYVKWALLLAPYIVLMAWTAASVVAALRPPTVVTLLQFVYCATMFYPGIPVRQLVGTYMLVCGFMEIFFEIWTAYILVAPFEFNRTQRKNASSTSPVSYRAHLSISLRLVIFSIVQLTPIILAGINHMYAVAGVKQTTEILESMDAMVIFLVFGTQRDVLQAWKFWTLKCMRASRPLSQAGSSSLDGAMV